MILRSGLPYRTQGCVLQAGQYLDVVIFGACHHQVVVARRLVYRETHHRPDVATQLPDGLQPEFNNTGQAAPPRLPKLLREPLPGGDPHSPGAPRQGLFPWGTVSRDTPLAGDAGEGRQPRGTPTSGYRAWAVARGQQPSAHLAGRGARGRPGGYCSSSHTSFPFL